LYSIILCIVGDIALGAPCFLNITHKSVGNGFIRSAATATYHGVDSISIYYCITQRRRGRRLRRPVPLRVTRASWFVLFPQPFGCELRVSADIARPFGAAGRPCRADFCFFHMGIIFCFDYAVTTCFAARLDHGVRGYRVTASGGRGSAPDPTSLTRAGLFRRQEPFLKTRKGSCINPKQPRVSVMGIL